MRIPDIGKQIVVSYNKKSRFISVGTEEKKESKKKNKEGYRESFTCSSLKQGTTVDSELELEKATFDYEGNTLTISIPKKAAPQKESKKITVNMK